MQACDVPDGDILSICIPRDTMTTTHIDNLLKLVASKANLIKKSVGAEGLPVPEIDDGRLQFEWFPYTEDADELNAYSTLVLKLCQAATTHIRVTAKEKQVENEKFAFRVFLIRLGFVGDEYKTARRILLRNLTGNSAFKNGDPLKANVGEAANNE